MEFTKTIRAPRQKVWTTLWTDATYRQWTAAFSEGSMAETDWKKDSKVLFIDGTRSGMVSTITENIPDEYMGITHLGQVKNGVEDLDSEEVKQWKGAFENYTLRAVPEGTELHVALGGADFSQEFTDYFMKTWPIALDKLKELAEKE